MILHIMYDIPGHPDVPRQSLPCATCEEHTGKISCVYSSTHKESSLKIDPPSSWYKLNIK